MPSYTTSLKLLQPSTGEYPGSWGSEINTRMTSLVDAAVAGTTTVTMTAANVTLTNANGVADQAKSMFLVLQGSPGGSYEVIVPSASKLYFVTNSTGFAQTVKTSAGSGISVPNGARMTLRCDGTDVVAAQNYFASMTLGSALPVASGGTGASTLTGILRGNGTSAFTAGNINLASEVTGTLPVANGGTGLTSFTANGVVYASSSSALATGSGLTFDGTSVFAAPRVRLNDANRLDWGDQGEWIVGDNAGAIIFGVDLSEKMRLTSTGLGIGTNNPAGYGNTGRLAVQTASSTDGIVATFANSGSTGAAIQLFQNGVETATIGMPAGVGGVTFKTGVIERMRIDSSGNLGIGTSSPAYKLDVVSGSGSLAKFTRGSISISAFIGASEGFWGTDTNHPLAFTTNGTERMRLDSSGQLGLGVVPSAWGGGMKVLEMSGGSVSISANGPYVNQNAFYDTAWKYKENGFAAQYQQNNGVHSWYTAPSGTAGNAISFTQAMTLDSSGNLGIGTISPGSKLDVNGTATFAGGAQTTPVAVTFSATAMTVDCALSNVFATTFTANVTTAPTISNPRNGQTINWFITQDGTGSRTMTWPTSFRWPSGATRTLSTTANSVDLLVATYLSSTGFWYASLSKGFTA